MIEGERNKKYFFVVATKKSKSHQLFSTPMLQRSRLIVVKDSPPTAIVTLHPHEGHETSQA